MSPRVHGVLDYLFAALFLLAPSLLDFHDDAAMLSAYVVGGALLSLSLLTRYPLGVLRLVPFPVHGGIEMVAALALVALPWLAGFQNASPERDFFVGTGIVLFGLWATTDYKSAEVDKADARDRQVRTEATATGSRAGNVGRAA
ncbi:SPW repeat domain-containing protein [Nannocystis bainbridge]|uniref:SPW repeat-containing integral membrane domain-containing protein n=1 Tax=Nannocystis bainbridge TaxID=2995303 RepID=A0ABT5DPU4_9BACT|nr:hypothetical protein [Nannocystis bainbridge]MDC0715676.1 hypothetical protein [Nannocystis bainbridge]